MPRDEDEDVTPVQSPSAMHRLGLATCPCCEGSRVRDGEACPFCEGAGKVALAKAGEWFGLTPAVKK